MSRNRILLVAAAALLVAWSVTAQSNAPQPGVADQTFANKAAAGGTAEVELARLALDKASSDRVKQFAQRMVDDHSKANDELKGIASQEGIDLPAAPDTKHAAVRDQLSGLSGTAFDKAYMDAMVKDHTEVATLFETESNRGSDAALKGFASKTLPTIREHLSMARDIQRALMSGAAMGETTTTTAAETTTTGGAAVPSAASNYPLAAVAGLALVGAGLFFARKR